MLLSSQYGIEHLSCQTKIQEQDRSDHAYKRQVVVLVHEVSLGFLIGVEAVNSLQLLHECHVFRLRFLRSYSLLVELLPSLILVFPLIAPSQISK